MLNNLGKTNDEISKKIQREAKSVRHGFPFCCMRKWKMGKEFLANCKFSNEKIIGGECSTPGIVSLIGLCNDNKIKKKINLNNQSNILLFGCEGDADKELYRKLLNS